MDRNEILAIFEKTQALLEGHFLLSSGLHSPQYFQCAKVLQYPLYAEEIAEDIAEHYADKNIDVVVSPAMGGIIIGHEVARALKTRFVFTERDPQTDQMTLRRGFELEEGEKALIVEDVLTTGGSVREVLKLLQQEGAEPVGVAFIVDRSSNRAKFGIPKYSVLEIPLVVYEPEECPLCKKGVALVKPGSRKKKLV